MFKRANKITALLVAAAAVTSLVPATAANAATRLGTKEGTIDNAVAYKDGKYLYKGYRTDDDNSGYYFNAGAGQKDKPLEDAEDYDFEGKYGEKYAYLKDNNDDYLVDLSTGKLIDDDVPEDLEDTATTKLRTALKKTEMYTDKDDKLETSDLALQKLDSNKFGETWYQYYATTQAAGDVKDVKADISKGYVGFTNDSGKYVHASYTANMYIYNKDKNKAVKIEKFNDDDKDNDFKVTLKSIKFLAQDKDNIYTLTTVNVAPQGTTTAVEDTQYFVQKISKAQGSQEDDAYLPKNVDSYQLNKDGIIYDNGDSKDAYGLIEALAQKNAGTDNDVVGAKVDGTAMYVYKMDGNDVKSNKIDLKKVKVDVAFDKNDSTKTYDSKDNDQIENVDTYLAKKDGDEGQDVDSNKLACSVDIDGNLWAMNDGTIYKFTGKDKKEMFTCDRALDRLDVYDQGSLIAWENESDAYTTVQEGKAETDKEVTPAQTGWVKAATGWTFYDASGKQTMEGWVNQGGAWYMMKAGVMQTGWYNANGTWYFLNDSGAMQTGWLQQGGNWYYLLSSGAMKTGWTNVDGTWYYLNANGSMAANTTVDGYTLGANGAWVR